MSEDENENSKFVYLNDSYELYRIPLDVETIIDLNDNEEICRFEIHRGV